MKNRLNFKAIIAIVIIGLSACKEEDTPSPILTNPKEGKLKEIVWDNDLEAEFEYNEKGLLSKRIDRYTIDSPTEMTYDFHYNAQNQLTHYTLTDQDGVVGNYIFEYEGDILKKISLKDADQTLLSYNTYTFNAQKQLVEQLGYSDYFGVQKLSGKFTFQYDAQGNLIELKIFHFNEPNNRFELLNTYQFENFDGKKRIEFFSYTDPFNPTLDLFKSNPQKMKVLNSNGVVEATQTYAYTYNAEGKPTKKQIVITGQSNAIIKGEFHFY